MSKKATLERIVASMDKAATEHVEGCPVREIAKRVGDRARAMLAAGDGPAQVATESYRAGWEGVFGKKTEVGQA